MVFDPKQCMFMPDFLVNSSANKVNGGGRFPMIAVPADQTFFRCFDKSGRAVDIYEIKEAPMDLDDQQNVFIGYWCPYEIDRTSYTTLTDNADYMFTATMDGCTFGIGQPASDGTVIVSHSNSASYDTPDSHAPMIADQKIRVRSLLGNKSKLFQPSDYRKNEYSALTFGVWTGKKWQFFAHRFQKDFAGSMVIFRNFKTVRIK